ncbi:hypothetical protein ISS07_02670 [Candidatus Woesearchaeota archaeon]|nr:hypothetical protein [Candidatus Woesearchaeota archaeon]
MVRHIPIVGLQSADSPGTAFYDRARESKQEGNGIDSIYLFQQAAQNLKNDLLETFANSNERKEMLEKLHECYQALSVEASLPSDLRKSKSLESSRYYGERLVEVAMELNGETLEHEDLERKTKLNILGARKPKSMSSFYDALLERDIMATCAGETYMVSNFGDVFSKNKAVH